MITEVIQDAYPAMESVEDDHTIFIDINNQYWWSDETYLLYGPYHSEHEARLDQLCYVYVYL